MKSCLLVPFSTLVTAFFCVSELHSLPVSSQGRLKQANGAMTINTIPGVIRAHLLGPGSLYNGLTPGANQKMDGYQNRAVMDDMQLPTYKDEWMLAGLADDQSDMMEDDYSHLLESDGPVSSHQQRNTPSKRWGAGPGRHVSSVLPPWNELCRLLNMAYCKRFRRAAKAVPAVQKLPEMNTW